MRTPAQREQEAREAKLEEIDRAVKSGSLVIRKMTPKERKSNPPQDRAPKRRR